MRKHVWLLLLVVAVLFVVGCGGGGGGRINISRSGTISSGDMELGDGSHADLVRVRATRDGYIVVTMSRAGSNPIDDPYLQAFWGSASTFQDLVDLFNAGRLIDSDDDSGPGLDAELVFLADDNETYTIVLNTSGPNDFGTYRYTIREVDDDEVLVTAAEAGDKQVSPEVKLGK